MAHERRKWLILLMGANGMPTAILSSMSKQWQKLEAEIPVRAAEMLADGQAAVHRGETLSAYRWAFVDALKWRDDSGLNRNSLQYRFANAVVQWMIANWPELG